MSTVDRLTSALLAFAVHRTPSKIRSYLRATGGPRANDELASALPQGELAALRAEAEEFASGGVDVKFVGAPDYPSRLRDLRSAPPVLFYRGNPELFEAPSIGMCGSRSATDRGLRAAMTCGQEVAAKGLTIVSGYAKGVDTETHLAALRSQGSTVIVLAEGISHFRTKRAFASTGIPEDRVLIVSQFAPRQRWTAGGAMTRNGVIVGLSQALVVVEAGETGGTLNAGRQAIDMQRPVLALQFADGATPPGNEILINSGATAVRSPKQLSAVLDSIQLAQPSTAIPLWP